jgi:membrane protease YdiL (CAAX protease family)
VRTAIGQRLNSSPGALATASAFAALIVAVDLALVWWDHYPETTEGRCVLALLALAANLWLLQGDLGSLGLRLTPMQGWRHWVRVSLLIGLAVAACILVGLGIWRLSGHEIPLYVTSPSNIGTSFLRMCLFAPMLEETTYRLAICIPLAVLLGPWKAIAVSGLAFGGLHVAYGNPSPENLVGGFFLAWAYLKSESIAVPVLLHGLGNLCALAGQVAGWYWFIGAG